MVTPALKKNSHPQFIVLLIKYYKDSHAQLDNRVTDIQENICAPAFAAPQISQIPDIRMD